MYRMLYHITRYMSYIHVRYVLLRNNSTALFSVSTVFMFTTRQECRIDGGYIYCICTVALYNMLFIFRLLLQLPSQIFFWEILVEICWRVFLQRLFFLGGAVFIIVVVFLRKKSLEGVLLVFIFYFLVGWFCSFFCNFNKFLKSYNKQILIKIIPCNCVGLMLLGFMLFSKIYKNIFLNVIVKIIPIILKTNKMNCLIYKNSQNKKIQQQYYKQTK
eukprot:TRINITY_DN5698_c0_g2_i2.p5 TRINITY_DN5698_c0_g2~~TRINITY_DN5698_c0_g2_i2.p5  ORF type:complete len:216 (-),score=-8.18 TRINITY_DN5698_c0_g2_i2:203-850(-)